MAIQLDYFEYANDGAAQAEYVSSDAFGISQQQTDFSGGNVGFRYNASRTYIMQRIKIGGSGINIPKIDIYIRKFGSPTGNIAVKIYTDTGDDIGVVISNGTSNNIDGSALGAAAWVAFTFPTPPSLSAATYYWVVLTSDTAFSTTHYYGIFFSTGSVYADGYMATDDATLGKPFTNTYAFDMTFKIYSGGLQCYSESTIKQQGAYSLKVIAVQTDSLNDTLIRTVDPTIDLSGCVKLTVWVYASRTGTNIEVKIHDSGGATITISIIIITPNVWTKIETDISAVADEYKDDIDEIKIEIIEAGAANTFYVDNFYAEGLQPYPVGWLKKKLICGYNCFINAYLKAKRTGYDPLKLPDGTVF